MAINHIIAVHSAKGGVGKSTVAVNLALGLAHMGARVGLVDADIYGPSIPHMLGNTDWPQPGKMPEMILPLEAHGLKFISMGNLTNQETPIIWRGSMLNSALGQFFSHVEWGDLDFMLIDMPPGTGDVQLTLSQSLPLSGVVVVTTPQELAISDTVRGARGFQKLEVPILGLIENMSHFVCDDCHHKTELFGESTIQMLADELACDVLGKIPIEPGLCASGDAGEPYIHSKPQSATAHSFQKVAERLYTQLSKVTPSSVLDLLWVDMQPGQRITLPPRPDQDSGLEIKALWQVSQTELGIAWRDREPSILNVRDLRLGCPCAVCIDEWTGEELLDPKSIPEDISVSRIQTVGRYAIQPIFSDGHDSGIFHFERIKQIEQKKS